MPPFPAAPPLPPGPPVRMLGGAKRKLQKKCFSAKLQKTTFFRKKRRFLKKQRFFVKNNVFSEKTAFYFFFFEKTTFWIKKLPQNNVFRQFWRLQGATERPSDRATEQRTESDRPTDRASDGPRATDPRTERPTNRATAASRSLADAHELRAGNAAAIPRQSRNPGDGSGAGVGAQWRKKSDIKRWI